jgi:protein FAM32A
MPTVIGGKLRLKGFKKNNSPNKSIKGKKTNDLSSSSSSATAIESSVETKVKIEKIKREEEDNEDLTPSERQQKKRMDKLLKEKIAKDLAATSYRQRLENFNHKLANTTEHNDIPRVSAAGNG